MKYKGYEGVLRKLDEEAGLLHGEVLNTRDVITFQGRSVKELGRAFRQSIDDYLAFCAERGERPEKPFSGKMVIRIPPKLHARIAGRAARSGKSLNAWIATSLERAASGARGPRLVERPGRSGSSA